MNQTRAAIFDSHGVTAEDQKQINAELQSCSDTHFAELCALHNVAYAPGDDREEAGDKLVDRILKSANSMKEKAVDRARAAGKQGKRFRQIFEISLGEIFEPQNGLDVVKFLKRLGLTAEAKKSPIERIRQQYGDEAVLIVMQLL